MAIKVSAQFMNTVLAHTGGAPTPLACSHCGCRKFDLFLDPRNLKIIPACSKCEHPCRDIEVEITLTAG